LYNPRLRRAYRIEDGIPGLLVDEAVAVTDDAEHQRMLDRASGQPG
ncbi:MAG: Trm112 family protein, partial [Mycobacterium sp.]|nr:Trm112 family protein [Mycobacterium sp.]